MEEGGEVERKCSSSSARESGSPQDVNCRSCPYSDEIWLSAQDSKFFSMHPVEVDTAEVWGELNGRLQFEVLRERKLSPFNK